MTSGGMCGETGSDWLVLTGRRPVLHLGYVPSPGFLLFGLLCSVLVYTQSEVGDCGNIVIRIKGRG